MMGALHLEMISRLLCIVARYSISDKPRVLRDSGLGPGIFNVDRDPFSGAGHDRHAGSCSKCIDEG